MVGFRVGWMDALPRKLEGVDELYAIPLWISSYILDTKHHDIDQRRSWLWLTLSDHLRLMVQESSRDHRRL